MIIMPIEKRIFDNIKDCTDGCYQLNIPVSHYNGCIMLPDLYTVEEDGNVPVQYTKVRFTCGDEAVEAEVKECYIDPQEDEEGILPLYDMDGNEYPWYCWGLMYENGKLIK